MISGGVKPEPEPSGDEAEVDGESIVYDNSSVIVGETLVTSAVVAGETMTI